MRIVIAGIAALLLADISAAAQAPNAQAKRSTPTKAQWTARTPDGQPDLQGTWVNFDSTPFETPVPVPARGSNDAAVGPPAHWADHDSPTSARRPSMVVDPPDGRVPVLPWAESRRDYDLAHLGDSWMHETPWVRCITRGVPGGMFPAGTLAVIFTGDNSMATRIMAALCAYMIIFIDNIKNKFADFGNIATEWKYACASRMSAASSPTRQPQSVWPKKKVTSTVAVANVAEGQRTTASLTSPWKSARSAPSQGKSGGLSGISVPFRKGKIQPPPCTISHTVTASSAS
jgi:hypothetical protein